MAWGGEGEWEDRGANHPPTRALWRREAALSEVLSPSSRPRPGRSLKYRVLTPSANISTATTKAPSEWYLSLRPRGFDE